MMHRRKRAPRAVRLAGRICVALGAFTIFIFGSMGFARRIEQNVALSHELARTEQDIRAIHTQEAEQLREIRRVQQPEGVIPYIYRRLRMVKPGQTLIYLVPASTPTP